MGSGTHSRKLRKAETATRIGKCLRQSRRRRGKTHIATKGTNYRGEFLIPDGDERQNDSGFDGLTECCGRSELSQREHLTNPAGHFRILRSREHLIIQYASFMAHVSFDRQRLFEVLIVGSEANPVRIFRADRLKQSVNGLLFKMILCQNCRLRRERAKQETEQEHRKCGPKQSGNNHRPQKIIKTVFKTDEEVVVSCM